MDSVPLWLPLAGARINPLEGKNHREASADDDAIADDIGRVLGLPAPAWGRRCNQGGALLLRDGTRHVLLCVPCKSWRCLLCLPHLRLTKGVHLGRLMMRHGEALFIASVAESAWPTTSRGIRRAGGEYARCLEVTFSTARIGRQGRALLPPAVAVGRLGAALLALDPASGPARPLTTSQGWAGPADLPTGYVLVRRLPRVREPGEIRDDLARQGIEGKLRREPGGALDVRWALSWTVSDSAISDPFFPSGGIHSSRGKVERRHDDNSRP